MQSTWCKIIQSQRSRNNKTAEEDFPVRRRVVVTNGHGVGIPKVKRREGMGCFHFGRANEEHEDAVCRDVDEMGWDMLVVLAALSLSGCEVLEVCLHHVHL